MTEEIWKPIAGFKGRYLVSNLGNVRSTDWVTFGIDGVRQCFRGRPMRPTWSGSYLQIGLQVNGKQKLFSVHRLVASAFIPNPDNKPVVNHISGVREDNRVENLEWATRSENSTHAIATGLVKLSRGKAHYNYKHGIYVDERRKVGISGAFKDARLLKLCL